MDLATIIGMVAGTGVVLMAIMLGGTLGQFVDVPSILIVVCGGLAATLIRFPLVGIVTAFGTGGKIAFAHKGMNVRDMIEEIVRLSDVVRRNGPLALENEVIEDKTLAKALQYVADGYELETIRDGMERERELYLTRLSEGQRVFKSLGDAAPAFGMIGTLVGLVQMLAAMDDPSKIGPAMAIALLTTLYGALVANLVCLPISDKLSAKIDVEEVNQSLIIDGVLQIREGKSPTVIREMLVSYLPEKQRAEMIAAAEAA